MDLDLPANVRLISSLPSDYAAYPADPRTLQALSAAEDGHFWHLSRNRLIVARLRKLGIAPPARFLDLGCGGGCVTAHLEREGYRTTGVDGHLSRVLEAAARAPGSQFLVHDLAQGTASIADDGFDAVGLFDVIEHLDAPGDAVVQAATHLRPGGYVVGTVPALMALWSQVDVDAGHKTRYELGTLREVLSALPGLRLVEVAPFNRHLVPMMWLQRKAVVRRDPGSTAEANFRVPPGPVNQGLLWLANVERRVAGVLDGTRLPGASLWFALERTAATPG